MNTWQTVQKSAYLSDFVELNKNLQQAVVKAVAELEQDPVTPRGDTIKKLKGYENVWRYRLGAFRLIYAVAPEVHLLRLLAVGPRSSIYQRFNYAGWDAPDAAVEFGPELVGQIDWEEKYLEWSRPQAAAQIKLELPRKLTPSLLTKWQIDPQYHPALMRCLYEDDLLSLPEDAVPPEVLGRVMDGLYPATAVQIASQPDHLLLDPEDLLRYADGTLTSFLLHLDEQQKPFVDWALTGPTLVKGGPGSGKSTVALYRIRTLVERALAETGEIPTILFTTYTKALINVSQSLLRQLLRDVLQLRSGDPLPKQIRVTTLHKTASWIARHSGRPFDIAGDDQKQAALAAARQYLFPRELGEKEKDEMSRLLVSLRDEYLLEEFEWVIEGQNCRTEADYLAASRVGRGRPFTRKTRTAVWRLYDSYRQELAGKGLLTWGQMTQLALDEVVNGGFGRRWQYVVVDEAQDLTPTAVRLCLELCEQPQGFFLTADANQSLYNRGFRWKQVHDSLQVRGRSRLLKRNYRSTREITLAAAQIMQAAPEQDETTIVQTTIHTGAPPIIYAAAGSEDQACWIAQNVFQAARELRLPLNAAVVLVSSSSVGEPLALALTEQGLPARFMSSSQFNLNDPMLKVTTFMPPRGWNFP
ncbi:MAG TPA: hypothetical protein EYH05_18690 [Anaerolineae bacterium]|nr:hypothetical protein [Anaerolineae bacterium]